LPLSMFDAYPLQMVWLVRLLSYPPLDYISNILNDFLNSFK
jgi:hypothetical protein